MANATGIRARTRLCAPTTVLAEVNATGWAAAGSAVSSCLPQRPWEMDRLYERICESGCVLVADRCGWSNFHRSFEWGGISL